MTFLDRWNQFCERCIDHSRRGKNEVENMRRCFYSGAIAAMTMLETVDTEKDDGGIEQVRSLMREMNEFAKEIMDEPRPEQRSATKVRKEF